MSFWLLDTQGGKAMTSDIISDNLSYELCPECGRYLSWTRRQPLVLKYDSRDSDRDVLEVTYFYAIGRASVAKAFLEWKIAGATQHDVAFNNAVSVNITSKTANTRPSLNSIDYRKAGARRDFDRDVLRDPSLRIDSGDFCSACGALVNESLVYKVAEVTPSLDISCWDGADIFAVAHVGVVCTDKVIDMLTSMNATGWEASEIEVSRS